ncbi:MAG: hypothetical protein ACT4N2_09265 [Hyphomicrobium sp.]
MTNSTKNNPKMQSLRVATVSYVSGLSDLKSRQIIPLGVLVELWADDVHGVGAQARPELTAREAKLIPAPLRDKLANPLPVLEQIVDRVVKSDDANAFAHLPAIYHGVLRIELIRQSEPKPVSMLAKIHGVEQAGVWAAQKIARKLNSEFDQFCDGQPKVVAKRARSKPLREIARFMKVPHADKEIKPAHDEKRLLRSNRTVDACEPKTARKAIDFSRSKKYRARHLHDGEGATGLKVTHSDKHNRTIEVRPIAA